MEVSSASAGGGWQHTQRTFTSGQGPFGEALPSSSQRHSPWRLESYRLAGFQAYVCSLVLFFAAVLCAAGGIGGGGIYVTLLMVAGRLGVTDAVPLSKAIVFFGSISSWVLNSRKLVAWETKQETAIDYNICRLVVPGALSGTLIGVILNRRLPSWTILAVLLAILVVITFSVGWTTVKLYLQEQAQDLADEQEEAAQAAREAAKTAKDSGAKPQSGQSQSCVKHDSATTRGHGLVPVAAVGLGLGLFKPRRVSQSRRPSMNAPDITKMRNKMLWSDIVFSLALLIIVITAGVLRFHVGECRTSSRLVQKTVCNPPTLFWLGAGTLESWVLHSTAAERVSLCTVVVPLCACLIVEVYYARLVVRYEQWRLREVGVFCVLAMLTGCLSGLVGIGGGLVFSPFFLVSGVHPSVAVATSSTCVTFTAASTSFQYLFTDRIIVSLALVYGAVSLVASYLGTSFVHFLEDRFWGRKSYVSFIVGLGVLISTALSAVKLARVVAR